MKVLLASVGNPDFNQDPDRPMYGCDKDKKITVPNFKEASMVCIEWIRENDLGSGNWSGGEIFDDNKKVIAHVSYNGRVWEGKAGDWNSNTKEIKL